MKKGEKGQGAGKLVPRRNFLGNAATAIGAATAFTILPSHVARARDGRSPNDKLNIAGIGVGGMGLARRERN